MKYSNMELPIEEIKRVSVEGLKKLDSICKSNNLKYYLAYGTLIGAVRHAGFIPWDDDIDVIMPRADCIKLFQLFNSGYSDSDWELLSYKTKGYYYYHMKFCSKKTLIMPSRFCSGLVYGISIDIFPMDILKAENFNDARIEFERVSRMINEGTKRTKYEDNYAELMKGKGKIRHFLKKLYFFCYGKRVHPVTDVYDWIEKEYNLNKGVFCTVFDCTYKSIWKLDYFGDGAVVNFENHLFYAPCDSDSVLRTSFGNYWELPPLEERVTTHSFYCFEK